MTGDKENRASAPPLLVGISISDPDPADLAARGISKEHVDQAFVATARQLLADGMALGYGGDFRQEGYTSRLLALLREYSQDERPPQERIQQFLAWPLAEQASPAQMRDLREVATPVPIERPPGRLPAPARFHPKRDERHRELFARSLTSMRKRMDAAIGARVVLGGALAPHSSRYPGVAEEAWLAAESGTALFVLGGFGGAAARVAAVVQGGHPVELTLEYQMRARRRYEELVRRLGGVDYEALCTAFRRRGPGRLRNGLSPDEDRLLLETVDLDLAIALIRRGLRRLGKIR